MFTFIAFGQSGIPGTGQTGIAALLANQCPDFYLACGNQVIRNNRYTATAKINEVVEPALIVQAIEHRYYNPFADPMARAVFYAAPGTEDLESQLLAPNGLFVNDYDDAVTLPSTATNGEAGDGFTEKYYSFDYGSAHFTVLRNFVFNDPAREGPSDLTPLFAPPDLAQLAFLTADVPASRKFWKILVLGDSPYTSKQTDNDGDLLPDDLNFRQNLEADLGGLESLGVDLVLCAGHVFFEHTHAVTSNAAGVPTVVQTGPHFVNPGAPVYVTTGGGGEPLWECLPGSFMCFEAALEGFTMTMLPKRHVTQITVDGNVLRIQPIETDGVPIDIDPNPAAGATFSSLTKTTFPPFRRADANQDGSVNLSDGVFIQNWLFQSPSPSPHCMDAADANDDEGVNLSDPVWIYNFLFQGGPPPPAPGPTSCGPDPTADALLCLEYLAGC
jgi:hypothetical protein